MRVALIQAASPDGESVPDRTARIGATIAALDHVDLVVLPELWAPGYFAFDSYADIAEALDGPLFGQLRSWTRELGVHLQAGSVLERDPDGRLYNAAVLIGPDGTMLLKYRKVHVFGYQSLEAQLLTPGDRADVADTGLGTVGMTTCYDLRFPELYRWLVDLGTQLLIVPAAWPAARLEHWQLFTRARAVENQVYLIACNAAGTQRGVRLGGHSVVVDPWGRTVAEAGGGEQVLYAEIDLQTVAATRSEFPVLDDRRLVTRSTFVSEVRKGPHA